MKPPEPLENTPIFHGKALWTVLERYRICIVSQMFVREKLKAKHRARQENIAALVGRWIDGHSRFCWCPFFYARNQVQRGARLGWTPWAASSFRGSGGRSLPIAALFFMQQPEHLCRCSGCSSKHGSYRCMSLRYFATPSQKRIKMVAIWARVALPAGRRVLSSKPWMRPSATAQATDSAA